ncbi:MAG: putative sporulation protein YtxC [Firmicutes bacterium]|nr:putative sporulation protein YtxC [Bacillota bacterium]
MSMRTIGIRKGNARVKNYILAKLDSLNKEDLNIVFEDYNKSDLLYIKCSLKEGFLAGIKNNKISNDLIKNIATILSDVIINNYEYLLIKKVIDDYYIYITEAEKEQIFKFVDRIIKRDDNNYSGSIYKQLRRNMIKEIIFDYLKTEDLIILDGFINFRLNDYKKELYLVVDRAFKEFIAQKEYDEFIKLLKYFVEIQDSKVDVIHIVADKKYGYILLDDKKRKISIENDKDLLNESSEKGLNNDDTLISSLISIAPKKIYIHNISEFSNKELIKTIQNVFSDRMEICSNCDICGFVALKSKNKLN